MCIRDRAYLPTLTTFKFTISLANFLKKKTMRLVIMHSSLAIMEKFGAYLVDLAIWEGDLGDLARFWQTQLD